jgi:hypothetical protein
MLGVTLGTVGAAKQDEGVAATGHAIVGNAETITESWLDLAEQNAGVKAGLRKLAEGGAVGGLVVVHLMCVLPFLVDRGVVPAETLVVLNAMKASGDHAG